MEIHIHTVVIFAVFNNILVCGLPMLLAVVNLTGIGQSCDRGSLRPGAGHGGEVLQARVKGHTV